MVKEAEANKEEDEKKKKDAEIRNEADSMVFSTEKALEDLKDKITEDEKTKAEELISEVKKALEGTDTDLIKSKTEELSKVAYEIAAKAYQNVNPEEASESTTTDDKHDDAEEANFEEK